MARVLINMPQQAKRGEIIEIKTLIAHPMETGYRLTTPVPRSHVT
jgi:sulfur-oxidizing protein SoxZ